MIRLTLNAQTNPEIHLFNKSTVLIGREPSAADLALTNLDIQPVHLKIIENNGSWTLVNLLNDPFVSLNGQPLGKKLLSSGDVIFIQDFEILFEKLQNTSTILQETKNPSIIAKEICPSEQKTLIETKESCLLANSHTIPLDLDLPYKKELEETLQQANLSLTNEIPSSNPKTDFTPTSSKYKFLNIKTSFTRSSSKSHQERKNTRSLKDDYLKDLDDDNQKITQLDESNHLSQAWRWILFFIFSIITIAGIIGTVIYFSVSDKTEAQETKAAQGVADIAIALTHAQLYHLKPHNQNWSDVDFLKTNLQAILPHASSYAYDIDSHGQFTRFPYSLRIYTSTDLSHFLLIAQPAPSLLQWLIPKSVILVDSQAMELRTIKDIRSLNRLLANPDPLDGLNGKEISALVKQGSLLYLSVLAYDAKQSDFAPPKNLISKKAGSENLIYNAPRYYRLGQSLIQKAILLSTSKGSSQEVASFKREVEDFSKLHNWILYTDQGEKGALQTKQGLQTFAPSDKILFGYVELNPKGEIKQAALLKDEVVSDKIETIALNDELDTHATSVLSQQEKDVDTNHPIYVKLTALMQARENELHPLSESIIAMLEYTKSHPDAHFQTKFQNLTYQYLMADAKHKATIKQTINELYQQYEELPINHFINFINETGCESLIDQNDSNLTLRDENCAQNLETLLTQIENAKSLTELDNLIHIAISWLTFDYIKNSSDLARYQNLLRNKVLYQLEKLILSSKKHLDFDHLLPEDKELLTHILSYERLIQSEERDFFLEEFERLANQSQVDNN